MYVYNSNVLYIFSCAFLDHFTSYFHSVLYSVIFYIIDNSSQVSRLDQCFQFFFACPLFTTFTTPTDGKDFKNSTSYHPLATYRATVIVFTTHSLLLSAFYFISLLRHTYVHSSPHLTTPTSSTFTTLTTNIRSINFMFCYFYTEYSVFNASMHSHTPTLVYAAV